MVNVRKTRAGSDSHGNIWETDGAVVDVEDPAVAAELIALPDGGFELVGDEELPAAVAADDHNHPGGTPVDVKAGSEPGAGDVVEVEPADDEQTTKPKASTTGRKTAAK